MIRIPRYSPGREETSRAELRCPDPSCNPYLAFAVMLEAGLDGIRNNLTPPPPVTEDVYEYSHQELKQNNIGTLPETLGDALEALAEDEVIRNALGEHVYRVFQRAKSVEWDEYRIQVTEWERDRYLEML